MARKAATGEVRKIVTFDAETWSALHMLELDSMCTFQELAVEAFHDLLAKHHRPEGLRQALTESVADAPSQRRRRRKASRN